MTKFTTIPNGVDVRIGSINGFPATRGVVLDYDASLQAYFVHEVDGSKVWADVSIVRPASDSDE